MNFLGCHAVNSSSLVILDKTKVASAPRPSAEEHRDTSALPVLLTRLATIQNECRSAFLRCVWQRRKRVDIRQVGHAVSGDHMRLLRKTHRDRSVDVLTAALACVTGVGDLH